MKEALTSAASSFDDAANHIEDILGGPGADPIATSTKKAAAISKIFLLNNQQQLAMLKGDKAGADKSHAAAIDAVKAAADMQVTFPNLPGDLAAAIPPPPAPAPTEPTTAPTTEGSTAEADSPDVQAIRAVMTAYIGALEKGDMDGAKAMVQIEPGQEDYYNQYATFVASALQFAVAMKDKFPDQPTMQNLDVAGQLKAMKVSVKGDEGFASQMPGQPDKKMFARTGDQWKLYVGPPTQIEQTMMPMMPMMQKLGGVFPTLTQDVKANKYATIQDVQKAVMQAMGASAAAPTTGAQRQCSGFRPAY